MSLTYRMAQILFDAGVRLEDEGSNCAVSDADERTKGELTALLLKDGEDIELVLNTEDIKAQGITSAVDEAAWHHIESRLTDAIDEELWIIQCGAAADAYTDARIDHIKENRSAA